MDDFQKVVLAALLHDLDKLPEIAEALAPLNWQAARQDPVLSRILLQAEAYSSGSEPGAPLAKPPLASIFSRVQLDHRPLTYYRRIASLAKTEADQTHLFPTDLEVADDLEDYLRALAAELRELVEMVELEDFYRLYDHLLAVLQRYAWCLPAHVNDVSLFDHLKMVSAVAACLYRYHEANESLKAEAIEAAEGEPRFRLLVGDLSGIQDYIFGIASIGPGGVARRLRARSFFMSLISDVLGHLIVHRFTLPLSNIIMSSGGKFYVLLPNLSGVEERIAHLREEIDDWLLAEFNGEIGANLESTAFPGAHFGPSTLGVAGFGKVVTDLSYALAGRKKQRSRQVLQTEGQWNRERFLIKWDFRGVGDCQSCGRFPASETGGLCPRCAQDAQLGGKLPKVKYVAYYTAGGPAGSIALPMGYQAAVLTQEELAQAKGAYLVVRLNNPDVSGLREHPAGFRYLANHVPTRPNGSTKTFNEIAEAAKGRQLLGYVKADVDHLGILFAQGLRADEGGRDTAAHLMALSRELDLFFSGWLEHTVSRRGGEYENFYTIFSGGDDLFLVGPWDKAAEFARHVNTKLRDFVGRNPDITLSAGVLFTKHRYPIARAAGDAEEVLEQSKEREWEDREGKPRNRNQLTVLGDTFRWEQAGSIFKNIETLKEHADELTSSFLYSLVQYSQMYKAYLAGDLDVVPRYRAMFAYNIARNLQKGPEVVFEWADELMRSLSGRRESEQMRHLGLVATYLLFYRRKTAES